MSMVYCRECGAEISDKAKSCPKCGAPVEDSAEKSSIAVAKKRPYTKGCVVNIVGGLGFYLMIALLLMIAGAAGTVRSSSPVVSPTGGFAGDMLWSFSWIILIVIAVMSFVLLIYKRMEAGVSYILCTIQLALSIFSFVSMLLTFGWALGIGSWLVMWPMLLQLIGSSLCFSGASKLRNKSKED